MEDTQRLLLKNNFIQKAIKVHSSKYDYSKVKYFNSHTKVIIICKEHGDFSQKPYSHLANHGCPKCGSKLTGNKNLSDWEEILKKIIKIHKDRYDYSKYKFKGIKYKSTIICVIHGSFQQSIEIHLQGYGCNKCSGCEKTQEDFILECDKIHNSRYSYDKVNYIKAHSKVKIICSKHGVFTQTPHNHRKGAGCPKCKVIISKGELELREFIISILGLDKILPNDRVTIKPYEIDIYIPSLKLGFEYNGKYWHSLKFKELGHRERKTKMCRDVDVTLIHIEENSWLKNKTKTKEFILSKLK